MISLQDKSSVTAKGKHILTFCDATSKEAQFLSVQMERVRAKREFALKLFDPEKREETLKQLYLEYVHYKNAIFKFRKREMVIENITTTVGRTVLARRLSGNTTYTGIVNYTALGSDATPAVVGNTQLGTEVYRKALSSGTYLNNVAYIETFFTAAEVTGTFEEYGMFIDGTGAANSGQLFNRFTSTNIKSATETMNCQSIVTFNDA